jgi:DNA transformation protein
LIHTPASVGSPDGSRFWKHWTPGSPVDDSLEMVNESVNGVAVVSDDVAYLKVDDSNREDFIKAGASPFNPYPEIATGRSYYEIPPDILDNPKVLAEWAERSLAIARKKKKP